MKNITKKILTMLMVLCISMGMSASVMAAEPETIISVDETAAKSQELYLNTCSLSDVTSASGNLLKNMYSGTYRICVDVDSPCTFILWKNDGYSQVSWNVNSSLQIDYSPVALVPFTRWQLFFDDGRPHNYSLLIYSK